MNTTFSVRIVTASVLYLSLITASQLSVAAVRTDIIAAQPTVNGAVSFTMTDTNTGLFVKVNALGILATDTPAQKAAKIDAAANAAIAAAGAPENGLFSSAVAGNTATITKLGGGGMAVNITADTTGEGTELKTKDSGGNGNSWWWRFVRWVEQSVGIVVPKDEAYALTTTNGFLATVTGDGALLASELQDEITNQMVADGVVFTSGTDISTGQRFLGLFAR